MAYFPFFQDIADREILIVGGGKVALRKAEKLCPFGPKILVVAPQILTEFEELQVKREYRSFQDGDIFEGLACVIAACDDEAVNRHIYNLCVEKNIPVNVVDNPPLCTFFFPSLIKRGKLTVGISTSGASPSAAIWTKENIEQFLPDNMETILDWLDLQRIWVKERVSPEAVRAICLKALFAQCLQRNSPLTEEERDRIFETVVTEYGTR